MKIFPAKTFDIPEIMKIERAAFIPAIQETQKTFEERLRTFPEGFLLLADNSPQTVLENKVPLIAGYFTSEIWNFIPQSDDFFTLGHSAQKNHHKEGSVLYFSSFALLPSFQGKKLAEPFLTGCLNSICGSFPKIKNIVLLVNAEWQGAKHLYEKLGFKEVRRIKDFFPSLKQEASDGIIMQKNVNSRDANC